MPLVKTGVVSQSLMGKANIFFQFIFLSKVQYQHWEAQLLLVGCATKAWKVQTKTCTEIPISDNVSVVSTINQIMIQIPC